NWDAPQTVTVTGVDDAIQDGTLDYAVVLGVAASSDPVYNGMDAANVGVSNTDDDVAGIAVTPTSGLTPSEAGGQASFTVVLKSQPRADVVILVASSNTAEGAVSVPSLTFTTANWNVPQSVTVTGVDDPWQDGTIAYSAALSAAISPDPVYNRMDVADV